MSEQPELFKMRTDHSGGLHFDGQTFDDKKDGKRLSVQLSTIFDYMKDGKWRTLAVLRDFTGYPEGSISARLRDFRKEKFGGHVVNKRRLSGGVWEYQLCV